MAGDPLAREQLSVSPARAAGSDYARLLAALASRARRLGAHDAEGSAQEALKRSLQNSISKAAVEYYFSQDLPAGLQPPEWSLDQLFAWLHGVLQYVVREEHSRVSNQREVPLAAMAANGLEVRSLLDRADPAPDQLDQLIQQELQAIVADCFPRLDREYRTVLTMRLDGLKYSEIAIRLHVNENTVATWVSRGIRELARCVQKRTKPDSSGVNSRARNTA
jgi:RNA polymerase sigma factor (sigma-70 family)